VFKIKTNFLHLQQQQSSNSAFSFLTHKSISSLNLRLGHSSLLCGNQIMIISTTSCHNIAAIIAFQLKWDSSSSSTNFKRIRSGAKKLFLIYTTRFMKINFTPDFVVALLTEEEEEQEQQAALSHV
jgi:hypothetical protein